MITGEPWTEPEIAVLRSMVPKFGPKRAHTRLVEKFGPRRTHQAVQRKSRALGLMFDPTYKGKYTALNDAFPGKVANNQAHSIIVRAAKADGVLIHSPVRPFTLMAPTEWVDAFMEKLGEDIERTEYIRNNWLTLDEACKLFGITRRTMISLLTQRTEKPYAVQRYVLDTKREKINTGYGKGFIHGWFFEPEDTRQKASDYRQYKMKKRLNRKRK